MVELKQLRLTRTAIVDGLLLASLLTLTFLFGCFRQKDADIWWHLKTGQEILARWQIPDRDWFTFTSSDRPWVDLHWLFQVAAFGLHSVGGMKLLTFASATIGMIAVAIQLAARRSGWSIPVAIASWTPVLILLGGRMYVRPEVVTLVCMSFFLCVLFHAGRRPWLLWTLLPVQVFWVNVQGLFILGPLMLGFFWLDGVWQHNRRLPTAHLGLRTAAIVASVAASLLNPYHIRALWFPIELFRKMSLDAEFYSKHISELQSIPQFISQAGFIHFYVWAHFGLLLFAVFSFVLNWASRRFDLFRLLTFSAFAWLSFQATRNSGQFALVAGTVTAWNFGEWWAGLRRSPIGLIPRIALAAVIVGLTGGLVSGKFYDLAGEGRQFGLGEHPLWHAHEAARFAARPGMPDRLIGFHLGQAAVFEFHKREDQRTFCDPRLEVVSRELLQEYHHIEAAIRENRPGWQSMLERHGLKMILVDHRNQLGAMDATLLSDSNWICAYFDSIAAVYVHRDVAIQLDLHAVNFSMRLFRPSDEEQIDCGAVEPSEGTDLNESGTRFHDASALYLVARSLSERPGFDPQLARSMLLLAASQAMNSSGPTGREFEPSRLLGQISFTLSPLTGRAPTREDAADFDWDLVTMLDLTRARYFLELSIRWGGRDDVISLAHLYQVAKLQMDQGTQRMIGEVIVALGRRNPAQRELVRLVSGELEALRVPPPADLLPDLQLTVEVDEIRRVTDRQLSVGRLDLAYGYLELLRSPTDKLPWDLANRVDSLRTFFGKTGGWMVKDHIEGDYDESERQVKLGGAKLVENFHRYALRGFEGALELNPNSTIAHFGLARMNIERGDAQAAHRHCQAALDQPQISPELRHNLEWMLELVKPFATQEQ